MIKSRFVVFSGIVSAVLGLSGIAKYISENLAQVLFGSVPVYNPQATLLCNSTKPAEILFYCCLSAAFIFTALYTAWLCRKHAGLFKIQHFSWVTICALSFFSIFISFCMARYPAYTVLLFVLPWVFLIHWPFLTSINASGSNWNLSALGKYVRPWIPVCILFAVLHVCYAYWPFVFGPVKLLNEFYDLPEQTYLNYSSDPLTKTRQSLPISEVDNATYLFEHKMLHPWKKYSYVDDGVVIPSEFVVPMPDSPALLTIVKNNESLVYNYQKKELVFLAPTDSTTMLVLCNLAGSDVKRHALMDASAATDLFFRKLQTRMYTMQESEFINKNSQEWFRQTQNRWVLSHHSFMLGPINDLYLGRPLNEITAQYGLGNAWWLMKTMRFFDGDITFQRYRQFWYLGYYLFFAMLIGIYWVVFKDVFVLGAGVVFSAALLIALGFDLTMLGPGANPMRRFFDLPIIYIFWLVLNSVGLRRIAWGLLLAGLCYLQLFVSREFGSFIIVSLVLCGILNALTCFKGNARLRAAGFFLLFPLLIAAYFVVMPAGIAGQTPYYLLGVVTFPISIKYKIMVLGFFSIASILSAYYWAGKEKPWPPISFLSLFLLLYASMAGLYFIVMGTTAHLLLSSWLLFLLAVSLLQMFTAWLDQKDFKNFTCSVLLIGGVIFNIVLFGQNFLQKRTFDKVFANHVVYQWNFHRLKAESTMDPVPFNAAVSLIQKYTNGPSVYIVSKYDMILPFLASRYSAMPWHILSEFMVTQKETQMAIDKIRSDRPELLFVDSDIERSYRYDIIPDIRPFRHLHDEAHWRAERLELLQEVFKAVEADYEPVEKTPLITAWRLRPARN